QLAGEINDQMPDVVAARIADALNEHAKSVKQSRVLILGVAYKKDIGDTRESPALRVIERLQKKGACVRYHDPHVPVLETEAVWRRQPRRSMRRLHRRARSAWGPRDARTCRPTRMATRGW